MADNVAITPGSGATAAADDIGGVLFQRVKVAVGADGVNDGDVSASNPMPIAAYGELIEAIEALRMAVVALTRSPIMMAVPNTSNQPIVEARASSSTFSATVSGTVGATQSGGNWNMNIAQFGGLTAQESLYLLYRPGADNLRRNISVT